MKERLVVCSRRPYETRTKLITLDKSCKGNYPTWILRSYGDNRIIVMSKLLHQKRQYTVVAVKSMVWPGAMSYFWQGQCGEIYMMME